MKLSRLMSLVAGALLAASMAGTAFAREPDELGPSALNNASHKSKVMAPHAHQNGQGHRRFGIPNIDSLVNWNGHYFADGYDSNGNPQRAWYYNTVGNPPNMHGTTMIGAPILPVSMDLRNFDGSPRYVNGQRLYYDATQYVQRVLASPVFANATYGSSNAPTQISDAIQRAMYWRDAKDDWHTLLDPAPKTPRVMTLIRGTYFFALYPDGSCCSFILVDLNAFANAFFPPTATDTSTPIGAAENAGDITTQDMSTFLFPNVFLYIGNPPNCCIIGFHTYDYEPADDTNNNTEKRYVLNYSSWISPGLFGGGFQDVTALSHEIAEIYNDPFVASDNVHDITPWWLAPNGNCQNNLETGDVIEGLPNEVYPITMNGYTYHPQNEALLQWFERQFPSSAIGGAYSYPNTQVLTALSTPQKLNCQ